MISVVRILFVIFSCLASSTVASAFPILAVGEKFSGTVSIDPSTHCSTCAVSSSSVFETFFNAGSISIDLAGTNFSGSPLYVEVSYDDTPSGPLGQWSGFAPTLTGSIQVLLDGASYSTSILPLDLSQYQPLPPLDQISFNGTDGTGAVYSYAGAFTSLTQLDQLGNFTFEGAITRFEVLSSAVPEASTWAMMILGALGIGLLARHRQNGVMPTAA
ncbi:hypothetical protein QWJ07_17000 [Frankia sp. RB7]|nr:hypothetical protein [Frankia sp. RB7]